MDLQDISVTILTKNSQKHLKEVLQALTSYGEVVLYDNGSTDNTLNIAKTFPNVTVIQGDFIGFGPSHNVASAGAKKDWIFSIDSDEIVSPELTKALSSSQLESDAVYAYPRHNYFNGKFIKWCGWYPDKQVKLYNRKKTRFSDDQVHEAIISEGMRRLFFKEPIIHYSYGSIADFLTKMHSYSTLFAAQHRGKKKSSLTKAIFHGAFAFIKSYFLKRGFMGGYEGFVISAYNSHTAFYKYLKLHEANLELKRHRR